MQFGFCLGSVRGCGWSACTTLTPARLTFPFRFLSLRLAELWPLSGLVTQRPKCERCYGSARAGTAKACLAPPGPTFSPPSFFPSTIPLLNLCASSTYHHNIPHPSTYPPDLLLRMACRRVGTLRCKPTFVIPGQEGGQACEASTASPPLPSMLPFVPALLYRIYFSSLHLSHHNVTASYPPQNTHNIELLTDMLAEQIKDLSLPSYCGPASPQGD